MKTIKGPALFLAQFAGDEAPFNSWDSITKWAADCGYKGVQVPSWDARLIDLAMAADSHDYCDDFKGVARENGVEVTELSTHLQGQLVAVHPAYDAAFDGFADPSVHGNPKARQEWAVEQVKLAIKASKNLGISEHVTFSGALAWPYVYPWPQRPAGLVETAFDELASRWRPILDFADENGVNVCYEIHPGEDLHDGVTFEMFLDRLGGHERANMLYDPSHYVLQCLDYLDNIDIYKDRIKMFHVKDAEFNASPSQGVYGGYQSWVDRAGRFRSLGDGQVDFIGIFSKLAAYDFTGWAVVEWECCLKHPEDGARERGRLYGPGLAARGLDPSRLIFVTTRRDKEALWAMEEALAAGAAAGAVGEIPALGMTETRRLQLAAAKGGAMGLILRGPVGDRAPSAALSRWRAEANETGPQEQVASSRLEHVRRGLSRPPGQPIHPQVGGFSLSLWRARGGQPGNWIVEQDAETFHLTLAAPLAGRAARAV